MNILILLFAHFIADFVCQSQRVSINKSTDNVILFWHCFLYSLICGLMTLNILFGLCLLLSHFAIDYVTSRITKKLYAKGDMHNFFVVIGFDQFLHCAILILLNKFMLAP